MAVISLDIGTTHCKVALVDESGTFHDLVRMDTKDCWIVDSLAVEYNPDKLWDMVRQAIQKVSKNKELSISSIAISGMAEAGLFVQKSTGKSLCPIMPWFDERPKLLASEQSDDLDRFCHTGLTRHHKYGCFKMAYRLQEQRFATQGNDFIWLSVPDYLASKLTGLYVTDPTLAARTWLYDIFSGHWMGEYLQQLGMDESNLPLVMPSGEPMGRVTAQVGLPSSTTVAISGHDHLCAASVSDLAMPGTLFDSMGTAETLMGGLSLRQLGQKEFGSGFIFGKQATGKDYYWMGSLAASGDSVAWAKEMLCDTDTSFDELFRLLSDVGRNPTGMVYLPYINGCNYPHTNQGARGAILGITRGHTKGEFLKAVLEGTAFEMEWIRCKASHVFSQSWETIHCSGGGTKNPPWMQIKADVSSCTVHAAVQSEATLLGCAYIAQPEMTIRAEHAQYNADPAVHKQYQNIFHQVYLPMLEHGTTFTRWRDIR